MIIHRSNQWNISYYVLTDRKMFITDCVIFNHLLENKNYSVLFKKLKNKKGDYLNYKDISKNNLQCIWDEKLYNHWKLNLKIITRKKYIML